MKKKRRRRRMMMIADDEEEEEDDDDDNEESANVEDVSVEEDKTENENIKSLIQSTVEYLIQQDKKELLELMHEFRKDVGEDFHDTVLELEELVDIYLLDEFLQKEPIKNKIDEIRRKLEGPAAILKS